MLKGKTALVTGSTSGIGLGIAKALAQQGANVVLNGFGDAQGPCNEVRAAAAQAGHGVRVEYHGADMSRSADIEDMMAYAAREFGRVDVLVNNAGLSHRSLLADTDASVLRRVMDVNFFGAVHCTQAALASVSSRRGTIVAVSSVAGFAPLVGRTGYAASKHALHGFFDSLRAEVGGLGVNVLLVCPSYVDTGIDAHALAGDGSAARAHKVVVGKLDTPASVATAMVDAVVRRRHRLVLSSVGKSAWWLSRLLPDVYERVMVGKQGAEFGLDARR